MRFTGWLVTLATIVFGLGVASAQTTNFGAADTDSKPASEPGEKVEAEAAPESGSDAIASRIKALDLRQRVAQLMLVTLSGAPLPDSQEVQFLQRYTPGGVIAPPMLRPTDARDYVEKLRQMPMEGKSSIPLFLGTNLYDLPKGRHTPNAFFAQLPSLLSIAAANDADATARLGGLLAEQLAGMGFNLNLGPSLELAPNLPSAKGSLDCLGSDPKFAASAGTAIIAALNNKGVVAVPMGFPGGGSNRTQREPAVLLTPAALLVDRDAFPFRQAIEQGARIIHVSNTYVPTLDPSGMPASLSSAVMRDLLRGKMKFEGVVLAGPMDSSDLSKLKGQPQPAITALKAGADMLLWNGGGSLVMKAVDEIVTAVNTGQLSEEVIDNALRRVLSLKEKSNLLAQELPEERDVEKMEKNKDFPEITYEIERKAITLLQNRNKILPLNDPKKMGVGVTGEVGVEELHDALAEYLKYVVQQPIRTAKYAGRVMDFEIQRIAGRATGVKTAICVFNNSGDPRGKAELVSKLQENGAAVVVVLLGYPSHLTYYAGADAILVAYCGESAYAETMKAMADVIVGNAPVAVMPIEKDMKAQVGQKQLFNPLEIIRSPAGALPVTINDQYPAGLFTPYDPTFTIKKAHWDFGDGEKSKEIIAEHTYKAPGRYPVTLTIVDKKGTTTEKIFHAQVE